MPEADQEEWPGGVPIGKGKGLLELRGQTRDRAPAAACKSQLLPPHEGNDSRPSAAPKRRAALNPSSKLPAELSPRKHRPQTHAPEGKDLRPSATTAASPLHSGKPPKSSEERQASLPSGQQRGTKSGRGRRTVPCSCAFVFARVGLRCAGLQSTYSRRLLVRRSHCCKHSCQGVMKSRSCA